MAPNASREIHLCVVQPLNYVHSMGLLDAALHFRHQFESLGARVTVGKNRYRRDAVNLVFGAHLGFDAAILRAFACVFVNLEQLGAGGSSWAPAYLDLLRGGAVIDYDADNLAAYGGAPGEVPIIDFGFAPYLQPAQVIALEDRPIDLLFVGSMNDRRRHLIERIERCGRTVTTFDGPVYGPERDAFIAQARAVLNCHFYDSARFEQVRAFQSLSIGTPVVSERSGRSRPAPAYERSVAWFDPERPEAFFRGEFSSPAFCDRSRERIASFRACNPRAGYERALEFALGVAARQRMAQAASPWDPQRLVQIGSGKDYRPGWLNLDILPAAQPDVLLDLGREQRWPLGLRSPHWGEVELRAGGTEVIYASNVLEHVPDLPALMGNCLALLREGGAMVIEVPYEKAPSAWQDPTHVRAMNENSWLYYTDWFWYLGWFEWRFRLRELAWIDSQLRPCAREGASFMRVTLEKVATTLAERMVARANRPDFGGLIEPVVPPARGEVPAQDVPASRARAAPLEA
jgi:hypothetical protein